MQSTSIVQGTNDKPVASGYLVDAFSKETSALDGQLLLGYPLIGTPDGRHAIDAIWISPTHGIVIFDLVEGNDPTAYDERQDDAANKLQARLRTHRELTRKRDLVVPINTLTFAPGVVERAHFEIEGYPLASDKLSLFSNLEKLTWGDADARTYEVALSAIQSISTIRSSKAKRSTFQEQSRGTKLKKLEDSINTLDGRQSKAVLETVEGVQRIRGLAGSGKTVVLALKAAYLHAQHPDWRIAVTFNTRSLKGQFRRLITNFSIEQAGEEPDWDMLRVLNAWGAPGGAERDGLYHEFCKSSWSRVPRLSGRQDAVRE